MKIIKKFFLINFILILLTSVILPIEFGFIAGKNTKPSASTLGFSVGSGFFVPMVKFEFELMKQKSIGFTDMQAGLKIRKKFGKFAPYAVIGAGARFEKFSIIFSNYDYFTYIGGGTHFYIFHLVSLRFDIRYQSYSKENNVRLSIGLFAHI